MIRLGAQRNEALPSKVPHGVIRRVQLKTDGSKMECPVASLVSLEKSTKSIVGIDELGRICDGANWIRAIVLRNRLNVWEGVHRNLQQFATNIGNRIEPKRNRIEPKRNRLPERTENAPNNNIAMLQKITGDSKEERKKKDMPKACL